jgi:hypothetical protein
MGGASSNMVEIRKSEKKYGWKSWKTDHLEELSVDGNIIKMDLKEIECKDVDCIHLAQDRDQWRVPVDAVMNSCAP